MYHQYINPNYKYDYCVIKIIIIDSSLQIIYIYNLIPTYNALTTIYRKGLVRARLQRPWAVCRTAYRIMRLNNFAKRVLGIISSFPPSKRLLFDDYDRVLILLRAPIGAGFGNDRAADNRYAKSDFRNIGRSIFFLLVRWVKFRLIFQLFGSGVLW